MSPRTGVVVTVHENVFFILKYIFLIGSGFGFAALLCILPAIFVLKKREKRRYKSFFECFVQFVKINKIKTFFCFTLYVACVNIRRCEEGKGMKTFRQPIWFHIELDSFSSLVRFWQEGLERV